LDRINPSNNNTTGAVFVVNDCAITKKMTTSSSNVVSPFLQSTQRLHWVFPSKEKMQEERMKAFEKIQKEILDLQESIAPCYWRFVLELPSLFM